MTFQTPCSQTRSSSETPPTIYNFTSLKYDLARQTAMWIQWNSIFLITGFIDPSVYKGLTQASSHLSGMVGEPLLCLLCEALLDFNDGILKDHFIITVLSFIEILSWARSFYYVFIFNLYSWHFVGEESVTQRTWRGALSMDTELVTCTCTARIQTQLFWFQKWIPSIMLDFLLVSQGRGGRERWSRKELKTS